MKSIVSAALIVFAATSASAGNVIDGAGVWSGTSNAMAYSVGDGHMLINIQSQYETASMKDDSNPMIGMTGECFGSVEIRGADATGIGNCVFTGEGEDMMAVRWVTNGISETGAMVGQWTIIDAAGSMEGASGGGSFHSDTDRTTGAFKNTLTGAMSLP